MNAHSQFAAGRHCDQMGQKNMERPLERLADALKRQDCCAVAKGTYFSKKFV